jgi:carbamoyltransferase
MRILSIHNSHNASICEINNNEIIYYQEAERKTKEKKSQNWTVLLDKYKNQSFNKIIFSNAFFYNIGEVHFKLLKTLLKKINVTYEEIILQERHHFFHACSAFYNSGFTESYALVIDGIGTQTETKEKMSGEIVSLYYFKKNKFKKIFKLHSLTRGEEEVVGKDIYINTLSLGKFYDVCRRCYDLKEPGSLMGLSSYTNRKLLKGKFYDPFVKAENLFIKKYKHFQFVQSEILTLMFAKKYDNNGFRIAQRAQMELEDIVLEYVKNIIKNKSRNLCVSGGVFMNTVLNSKIIDICPNIYVDPFADDSGLSMGAAQWYANKEKFVPKKINTLFLGDGPDYRIIGKRKTYHTTPAEVAKLISEQQIIGIYQGRNEMGKRALGNRSFLFDPRHHGMKDKINLLKGREWFRPTAGTVLQEHAYKYFDMKSKTETPFMSYVFKVKRNTIPAITHVDNTCRIQTLTKQENLHYYNLIEAFYERTGIPILGNTSLNLSGNPLVNESEDMTYIFEKDYCASLNFRCVYLPELSKLLV